jgi:3-dehydroquinate synthase
MSDMSAKVVETTNGFHVEGYEKIEYDFSFTENIFDKNNDGLAKQFTRLNRCLAVMDTNIFNVYGQQLKNYFDHYNIELKVHKTMIGEKAKSMETLLSIVDSMTEFGKFCNLSSGRISLTFCQGIIRKEPVLVVGGGLVTDVTG